MTRELPTLAVSVTTTSDACPPDAETSILYGADPPGLTPEPLGLTHSHSFTALGEAEGDFTALGEAEGDVVGVEEGEGEGVEVLGVPVAHELLGLALLFATVRAVVPRMAAVANRQPAAILAAPCARMVIRPIRSSGIRVCAECIALCRYIAASYLVTFR